MHMNRVLPFMMTSRPSLRLARLAAVTLINKHGSEAPKRRLWPWFGSCVKCITSSGCSCPLLSKGCSPNAEDSGSYWSMNSASEQGFHVETTQTAFQTLQVPQSFGPSCYTHTCSGQLVSYPVIWSYTSHRKWATYCNAVIAMPEQFCGTRESVWYCRQQLTHVTTWQSIAWGNDTLSLLLWWHV